jgi:DnaJ-class molecular chaperone
MSKPSSSPSGDMRPGDEAPRGTPGTGEDVCPVCRGSGRQAQAACQNCGGTGKITKTIGGG